MRATILPEAITLTKAHTVTVSMMAKGCIVARVLPLRSFLFLLPNYIHVYVIIMQYISYLDEREVLQQEYSQPPILPSPHFQWVVNTHLGRAGRGGHFNCVLHAKRGRGGGPDSL